jgi:simple sugar transport system permease protein
VVTIFQGTIVLAVVVANEIARRVARRSAAGGSAAPAGGPTAGDGSTGVVPTPPPGSTDQRQGAQA